MKVEQLFEWWLSSKLTGIHGGRLWRHEVEWCKVNKMQDWDVLVWFRRRNTKRGEANS